MKAKTFKGQNSKGKMKARKLENMEKFYKISLMTDFLLNFLLIFFDFAIFTL